MASVTQIINDGSTLKFVYDNGGIRSVKKVNVSDLFTNENYLDVNLINDRLIRIVVSDVTAPVNSGVDNLRSQIEAFLDTDSSTGGGGGGGGISTNDGTFATPENQVTTNTTLSSIEDTLSASNAKNGFTENVVDITLTAPTTQYTLGDAIGESFTITGAGLANEGTGVIKSIEIIQTLPDTAYRNQSVTVGVANPGTFTISSNALVVGNRVRLNASTLPGGFSAGTDYYVVSKVGDAVTLAATVGGAGIQATSSGSSVTLTSYPAILSPILYLANASIGSISDNAAFYPTEAQNRTLVASPLFLSADANINDYHVTTYNLRDQDVPYKLAAGSTTLYGVLIYNGPNVSSSNSTGVSMVTGAKIRMRIKLQLLS